MKTIYNTYVPIESQEHADRMKQLCLDNELPNCGIFVFDDFESFGNNFCFWENDFDVWAVSEHQSEVTEAEFIELLKQHKG